VQHFGSAELDRFGTSRVTADLQGVILGSLSIEEKYISSYVVYPPEKHIYFHNILLYWDAAAALAIDKAIS